MPFISSESAPRFALHGAEFVGLASPSRGAAENAVWMVTLHADNTPVPHRLSREETFVCIAGRAFVRIGAETHELTAGGAVVVPAETELEIRNPDPAPFRAVAVLPVGGQARIDGQAPFVPPWAA
jgi:quercetin dioxygenase-like cupin family protein